MQKFGGLITALVTPMHEDESVDYEGFRALVKRQCLEGVDGILPLGTTAETPTLTEDEEDEIIKIVFEEVRAFEKSAGKISIHSGRTIRSSKKFVSPIKLAVNLSAGLK